jgi:hypothetical protein
MASLSPACKRHEIDDVVCSKVENTALTLSQLQYDVKNGGLVKLQVQNDEPVLVNVGPHGQTGLNERLGSLEVVDCYDEKYLVAHSIASGNSVD